MSSPTSPSTPSSTPAASAAPATPGVAAAAATAAPTAAAGKRRRALGAVAAVTVLAGGAYGAWWAMYARHFESTDNAYVQAKVVQVTALAAGTVQAVEVDDNNTVKAGQVLLKLDATDAKLALEQAQAQLAQTVREVRQIYVGQDTLGAQIALRQADLRRAETEQARAQDDVNRRAGLVDSGAVGREEFNHAQAQLNAARNNVAAAKSALDAAREQQRTQGVLIDDGAVESQPQVQRAAAKVREAWIALHRTALQAPVDGQVARRSVQLGQRVQPGTPVMSVVDLQGAWVDANFKESQLGQLRIGQVAELVADVYGDKVRYHGRITGLGAGTGAAFSLLPAQNATGNWIKVVQRVPVRIELNREELALHPLRVGLSMEVTVDVSSQQGAALTAAAPKPDRTQIYDGLDEQAQRDIDRIIQTNQTHRAARATAPAQPVPPAHAAAPRKSTT